MLLCTMSSLFIIDTSFFITCNILFGLELLNPCCNFHEYVYFLYRCIHTYAFTRFFSLPADEHTAIRSTLYSWINKISMGFHDKESDRFGSIFVFSLGVQVRFIYINCLLFNLPFKIQCTLWNLAICMQLSNSSLLYIKVPYMFLFIPRMLVSIFFCV